MAVLALIRDAAEISQVISWSAEIAYSRNTALHVLCWHYTATPSAQFDSPGQSLDREVRRFLRERDRAASVARLQRAGNLEVREVGGPDADECAIRVAHREDVEFIVAAAPDQTGAKGATFSTSPLLKKARCSTMVLFGGPGRAQQAGRVFVLAADSPHDGAALFLANQLAGSHHGRITLTREEPGYEEVSVEVGRRDLDKLLRDTGLEKSPGIHCDVLHRGRGRITRS